MYIYYQVTDGCGAIRLVDNDNLNMKVVADDYKLRTDKATSQAAEAARSRTKAASNLDKKTDLEKNAEEIFRKQKKLDSMDNDDDDDYFDNETLGDANTNYSNNNDDNQ